MRHLRAELYDINSRKRVLFRLREYLDNGYRDPELLYLGGRYAVSLGMEKEACRFLDPLAKILFIDGQPSPAYIPVGLLYLQILPTGDNRRQTILKNLRNLAQQSEEIANLLQVSGCDPNVPSLVASPHRLLNDIKQNNNIKSGLFELIQPFPLKLIDRANGKDNQVTLATILEAIDEAEEPIRRIQILAAVATAAYQIDDLVQARLALESILLLDGDQPDVLRNLITIASEQQDIESYERYWRRYVKVLLWRIMRGDGAITAWEDLTRFYSKVASVMDRELSKSPSEVIEILKRPGFLPRWLETHAGLIWLESAAKSRREWQTHLNRNLISEGHLGHLALMKYWHQLFYPEFYPYLDLGTYKALTESPLPSVEREILLSFNPALKLISRFLEWSKFQFALQNPEGRYAEALIAIAGCVARIPVEQYTKKLVEIIKTDSLEKRPFRQMLQETCSSLLGIKLSKFLNGEVKDWAGVVNFFGDPDIKNVLTPPLLTQVHIAETNRTFEEASKHIENNDFDSARSTVRALPDLSDEIKNAKENFMSQIDVIQTNKTFEEAGKYIENSEFDPARAVVKALPDLSDEIKNAKENFMSQIDVIQANKTFEQASKYIEYNNFGLARQVVKALPDLSIEIKDAKENFLSQINNIEANYVLKDVVPKIQNCVSTGDFIRAREIVRSLPDSSEPLADAKKRLMSQLEDAENQYKRQFVNLQSEIPNLLGKLALRGITVDVILKIAQDNNVDISNQRQFYSLLKAIDEQL